MGRRAASVSPTLRQRGPRRPPCPSPLPPRTYASCRASRAGATASTCMEVYPAEQSALQVSRACPVRGHTSPATAGRLGGRPSGGRLVDAPRTRLPSSPPAPPAAAPAGAPLPGGMTAPVRECRRTSSRRRQCGGDQRAAGRRAEGAGGLSQGLVARGARGAATALRRQRRQPPPPGHHAASASHDTSLVK